MIIKLRGKFESVLYKWGLIIFLFMQFGISDFVYGDPISWFNLIGILAFLIYLVLKSSEVKLTIIDNQQIDYYWSIYGFKFGLKHIHKSEVKEVAIVQLPSRNYALIMKVKGLPDLLLKKASNKKKITTQVSTFLANFNDQEFFPQFEIVTYPPISYIEKQILPDKPIDNTTIEA